MSGKGSLKVYQLFRSGFFFSAQLRAPVSLVTDNRREDRPSAGGERWNVAICAGWHHGTPGNHRPGQHARRRWRLLPLFTAPRAPTLSIRVATTMSPAWSPTTPTRGCLIGASTRAGNSPPLTILRRHNSMATPTSRADRQSWSIAMDRGGRAGGGAGSANSDLRPHLQTLLSGSGDRAHPHSCLTCASRWPGSPPPRG